MFQILRRHFGDEDAESVVDALQDEFPPTATREDLSQLHLSLTADIRAEINAAILKMAGASALIAGIS